MERRQFLGWMSVGILASSLPVVLAACNRGTQEAASPTPEGNDTPGSYQAVTTVEQVDAEGFVVDDSNWEIPVLVFRNPTNEQIEAVNPRCPHRNCTVDWQPENQAFVCPCHGAEFNIEGEVTQGPAEQNLAKLPTQVENGSVLVQV